MVNEEQITEFIHKEIIDFILKSPLNIESIPDDIEREMYEKIFHIIHEKLTDENNVKSCCECLKNRVFGWCLKSKTE